MVVTAGNFRDGKCFSSHATRVSADLMQITNATGATVVVEVVRHTRMPTSLQWCQRAAV